MPTSKGKREGRGKEGEKKRKEGREEICRTNVKLLPMRLLGLVYLPKNPHRHRADMHALLTEMKCCARIGLHVLVGPFVQRVSSTHFMESFYSQFSAKVYSAWRGT